MRHLSTQRPLLTRRRGLVVLATAALALILGTGALIADGGDGPSAFGGGGTGGDTVGSLPLLSIPPPGFEEFGPDKPSLALTGRDEDVRAVVADAYGLAEGACCVRVVTEIPETYRYEFFGRLVVLVDRGQFQERSVATHLLIGASFQGGLAEIRVGGQLRATQVLHEGLLDLRLRSLDNAGVLNLGLNWHAANVEGVHRVIAVKATNNLIKVEQRE